MIIFLKKLKKYQTGIIDLVHPTNLVNLIIIKKSKDGK
jgi:hypothetical protein